jgi:hypothetical protein
MQKVTNPTIKYAKKISFGFLMIVISFARSP